MKKISMAFIFILTMGLLLGACSGNDSENNSISQESGTNQDGNHNQVSDQNKDQSNDQSKEESSDQSHADQDQDKENGPLSTRDMADKLLEKVEQPSLLEMEEDMVRSMYYIDPALLEEYTILFPMMNVKTNEIAILKVKDSKDLPTLEEGVKKRAEDIQKQFETYLPDQYQNAKNYKLIIKGEYLFFVISEAADQLEQEFNSILDY